jgi:uncharacterized membrane protein
LPARAGPTAATSQTLTVAPAASTLAPFNYFQLVLAVIFGELFFAQMPSLLSLAGMALIVAAGLSLTLPMLFAYFRAKRS